MMEIYLPCLRLLNIALHNNANPCISECDLRNAFFCKNPTKIPKRNGAVLIPSPLQQCGAHARTIYLLSFLLAADRTVVSYTKENNPTWRTVNSQRPTLGLVLHGKLAD